jgi:hypothetical protein
MNTDTGRSLTEGSKGNEEIQESIRDGIGKQFFVGAIPALGL